MQYAALLSPPQHRTSLLRLQPAAQKGLAATETNTLVFMVLEGEVTVVLNTTQFLVTRGDSFFVPPHNSYNLLNLSAATAELFLLDPQPGQALRPGAGPVCPARLPPPPLPPPSRYS